MCSKVGTEITSLAKQPPQPEASRKVKKKPWLPGQRPKLQASGVGGTMVGIRHVKPPKHLREFGLRGRFWILGRVWMSVELQLPVLGGIGRNGLRFAASVGATDFESIFHMTWCLVICLQSAGTQCEDRKSKYWASVIWKHTSISWTWPDQLFVSF